MIGTLCRLHWPFTDLEGGKIRPGVIMSEPDFRGDIEIAMITSNTRREDAISIEAKDYREGTLPKSSAVCTDRLLKVRLAIVEILEVRLTTEFVTRVRKAIICFDTAQFSKLSHATNRPGNDPQRPKFAPGQTIPYAARVFDETEVRAAVSSMLDFWLTLGPEGEAFEKELAGFLGVKHSLAVNSGSSANLVALSALTTHKLPEHKRIQPGDEVITVAAGFPTTVAPIIQCGGVPVFIDAIPQTGNADCSMLEAAFVPGKTKAVMMAHALGNPFDLATVLEFCRKHDLWLIEDNCDALGCTYSMPLEHAKALGLDHLIKLAEASLEKLNRGDVESLRGGAGDSLDPSTASRLDLPAIIDGQLVAYTGSFGDLSTQSFYPPHHLTMGEGGAVNIIRRPPLKTYAESFRDWGRDCWCPSGKDNTCNKRFGWQLGELPEGYDHKYIYSHLGYNLKPLDPQAAIGRVQLRRLPGFIEARKENWEYLRRGMAGLEHLITFALPTHATAWIPPSSHPLGSSTPQSLKSAFSWDQTGCRTDCSWFGFKMTIHPDAPFTRTEFARHLDEHKIGNRMLFGGNLVRQPAFVQLRRDNPAAIRISGGLSGADTIMNQTIFIGTYPGLTREQLDYEIEVINAFALRK